MNSNNQIARAVRHALLVSAVTAAGSGVAVRAQDQPDAPVLQTVTVTGSRIATPNLQAISPVTSISGEDIEQTGRVRVEDLLNTMPQVFAAQGAQLSNGSTGAANVNLRNLDSKRTLVLINGRRLGPGDPQSGIIRNTFGADLNTIPAELIERVDVLTGGASSVYGADAVGGVVNFVMNTHFEGVKFSANYGFNEHHNDSGIGQVLATSKPQVAAPESEVRNGFTKDVAFLLGFNTPDSKGNATFYATYRNIAPIKQSSFDYSACTLRSGDVFTCGGSSTTGPPYSNGRFRHVLDPAGDTGPNQTVGPNGTLTTYPSSAAWTAANAYNFGPLNYYQRPDERYTAGAFLHYELNEHADVYSELMYMHDDTTSQIAPSGAFYGGYPFDPNQNGALTVNCSNPFLSANELASWCGGSTAGNTQLLIGRRNVEGGPRQNQILHVDYRVVFGSRGDINDAWKYDVFGQYGQVERSSTFVNDVSWSNIQNALQVVNAQGVPTCMAKISGLDPRCVPWNIFAPGAVTPEALAYLAIPLLQRGTVIERVVDGNVTGDLGKYGVQLPTAKTGLIVNVGAEYRQEKSNFEPDAAFINNLGAGQGGATLPVAGGYSAREVFLEARLPVAEDLPFAHNLSAETGYRYSDYSLDFKTNTYKFGVDWSPIEDIRFRGSFQRAVRVPNIGELYAATQVVLDGVTDPCSGPSPAFSAAQCAHTGVTATQYGKVDGNPASQYNGLTGGNPHLQPETALTKSFGVTLQPSFVSGLHLTVDYFDIKITNAITNPNADFTLLLCAQTGDPAICSRIHRAPDGTLGQSNAGYVVDTLENIGGVHTKGFDIDAGYRVRLGSAGRLDISLIGTRTNSFEFNPQPNASYDCAGFYGAICNSPQPKWRHTLRTSWATPLRGLDVSVAWRYLDSVDLDAFAPGLSFLAGSYGSASAGSGGPTANPKLPPATDVRFSSRSYLDLTASYQLGGRYRLRLGVNNVTDKDPPLNGQVTCPAGACNGNTWPAFYDAMGRFIFGNVSVEF